jgi:ubiquitin-protein ligase E3 C
MLDFYFLKLLFPCFHTSRTLCFLLQVVELKFGGKDIPVTGANRIAYIHLVADYRLNKQIRPHCLAFRQGLANVVSLEWLRMFDQQEIQVS